MPTRGRHHEHDLVVDPTVLIDQEVPEPLHSPEGLGRWGREHAGMKQLLEEVILRGAHRRASSRWSDSLPAAGAMARSSRRYPSSSSSLARRRSRSTTRDLVKVLAIDMAEVVKSPRGPRGEPVETLLVADEKYRAFLEHATPD